MNATPSQQRFLTNWRSIRWRLPLSYAAIALLAAVALGGVLLLTLRSHYDRLERNYLQISAESLVAQIENMYRDQLSSEEIQSAVGLFTFLVQARVRLLDETMQVVADSGSPSELNLINVNFPRPPFPDQSDPAERPEDSRPYLSVSGGNDNPSDQSQKQFYRYPVRMWSRPFERLLDADLSVDARSDYRLVVPIYTPPGPAAVREPVGYLELLEGPAFGNEIVGDVAEKVAIAGVVAVLAAAVVGLVVSYDISRPVLALAGVTARMATGDLAVRIELNRRDEFGQLAETFNTMAARVESTVNMLKRFVADAAHEINTPLTALRTNLELAALGNIPDATRADLKQALGELTRLEMLTHNLLALTRLEAPDAAPARRSVIDLTALVRQMHERYASRAEQREIAFIVDAPDEAVSVRASLEQFSRVLDNLLDNALKFTPQGGQITLRLRVEGSAAHLSVHDTGIGIPEGDLSKLFERFHRGRNAAAFPGNGLGLAITRAIVEKHGGQISAHSDGSGACFRVVMPVAAHEHEKEDSDDDRSHSVS
ncbi:MAG: HAMP domain-containing histidine kinase [Anaerolineae bacterium]|nr:HAMP domain-containing histidine kinase [Anaerolineae bacterium]